jgi:predicted amidohydrolase
MILIKRVFNIQSLKVIKRLGISMAHKHNIAICQLTNTDNKEQNFNVCKSLILEAKEKNAKMVFLPESFDFLAATKEAALELSEPIDGPLMNAYRNLARENQIWLSLGGLHRRVVFLLLVQISYQRFFFY